jgi:hypothetical protein
MVTSNTKPRVWLTAAAGALAFTGGDKMGAQAFADEPPAKTAIAPDAKLNAMIATLEAGFGHRTSGSKDARDYVAGVENVKKRTSLNKQLTETVPALIADLQDNAKRAGARKKLDQEIDHLSLIWVMMILIRVLPPPWC